MRPSAGVYHSCDVRIRKEHTTFWKRLASQGGWLYSLSESETVHILCSGLSDKIVVLKGVGILHLSANCVERTRSATLTGIRTYDSTDQYVYAPQVNLNVSSIVLEIDNREPRDSIALPTLEEQHQTMHEQQRSQENGDSLFALEEKIREIGQHRRERQQQKQLLFGGLVLQGSFVVLISLYYLRARVMRHIRCPLSLCKKRRRTTRKKEETPAEQHTPGTSDRQRWTKDTGVYESVQVKPTSGRTGTKQTPANKLPRRTRMWTEEHRQQQQELRQVPTEKKKKVITITITRNDE